MQTDATPNPLVSLLADLPPALPCLSDYLVDHATRQPDAEAAVEGARRMTYAELATEVARLAALLRQFGIGPGERVAVLAPPSIDFLVSFLATTSLGGIWLGLNPKHTRAELHYILSDAAPRVVLARSHIGARDFVDDLRALQADRAVTARFLLLDPRAGIDELRQALPLLGNLGSAGTLAIPREASAGSDAMLVYTSGTTGVPKGALLSHRALIRGALARIRLWPISPWRAINNLPINHIGAAGDINCTTFVAGGCQVFMEKFDPAATLRLVAQERVTFWYQIPTMFQLCLDHPEAEHTDWSRLDTAIWSGGRASHELVQRLGKIARHLAVDYSMTESVGSIALTPRTRDLAVLSDTVGWPDPQRGIRVVDPISLAEVATGELGEIQVNDDWRFSGYRGASTPPDAYASDGWFRTGDLAVRQPNGALKLIGRLKEMYKSGGYNVYPKEIEQIIESHPQVISSAVVPISDALYGEVGMAFVIHRGALTEASLEAHCRDSLANYKIPKRFALVTELPLLPTGKVDRMALRERARMLAQ